MTVLVNSPNLLGFTYLIFLSCAEIANGNFWTTLIRQGGASPPPPSDDMCTDDKIDCYIPSSCNSLTSSRDNCNYWTEYCKWECGACWNINETPDCPEFHGCYYYSSSQYDCENWEAQGCTWVCGSCIEVPTNDTAECYKICNYCDCMFKEGCIAPEENTPCRQSKIDHSTKMGKVPKCEINYEELHACERLTNKFVLYDGAICFVPAETHDDCPEPTVLIAMNLNGKSHKGPDNISYDAEDGSQGNPVESRYTMFRIVDNVEVEVTEEDAPLYKTWVTLHPRRITDAFCLNYEVPEIVPGGRYELVMSFIEDKWALGTRRMIILKIGKLTLPIKFDNYPFEGRYGHYVYEIRVVFLIREENDRAFLDAVGNEYMLSVPKEKGPITISICTGDKEACIRYEMTLDLAAFYVQRL